MPMHLKGGFKSKNGLVTYGDGGAYGAAPAAKRMMKKASKGLEALAAANPELTYKKKMFGGGTKKKKSDVDSMYGNTTKQMTYGGSAMKPKRR
tara:strand:+ start:1264 stop:1542 length:279 start_codon:yes stop_codon:yes gene_type:complete